MLSIRKMVPAVLLTALSVAPTALADDDSRAQRRTPVVDVFEHSRDAVVNISTTRIVEVRSPRFPSLWDDLFDLGPGLTERRQVHSVGSGFVVHPDGYIVTNAHVVAQVSDVQVTFADQRTADADIVAVDPEHDLAVLRIPAKSPLRFLKLGRSDDIMVGETVVAIGNPLGFQHTVTAGIVSALHRDLTIAPEVVYKDLIQTDASINPGNSGGPLLNVAAELIGINTAIRGDAQNIGFAIPVDRLWSLLPQMLNIEHRQRVHFGLEVYGPEAEVRAVHADSPAAQAGLAPGDRLVKLDDQPVRDAIDYYVRLLEHKPGDRIRLDVRRGERSLSAEIPLEAIPPPDGGKLAARLLGMKLGEIPVRERRELGLPGHIGVTVDSIDPGGPADRIGIAPGDLLLRLQRVSVPTVEEVGLALETVQPNDWIVVEWLHIRADRLYHLTQAVRAAG